ncbi:MAG: hypothetical protein LBR32_10750 [Propionibacteriaceae bacterium]|nr:hypothetical protein [Propionibacteriaceae bacterium]
MTNLTLAIDEEVLLRARMRALRERTSVNAVVRSFVSAYADQGGDGAAMGWLLELADKSTASSGVDGRTWTRDDAHER